VLIYVCNMYDICTTTHQYLKQRHITIQNFVKQRHKMVNKQQT